MISAFGWAAAVAWCVLAIPAAAMAQVSTAGVNGAGHPAAPAPQAPPAATEPPPDSAAPSWSRDDIAAAEAHCAALLRGLNVVAVPEPAIREGAGCGAAAPMKLVSLGKSPQVALSPPPTLTCEMIVALHMWLLEHVQPLARAHLGAPVIRIETMSSYSCRNAYGRVNGHLSEHARANALDIGAFITARAESVRVATDWGPTAREIAAAAKAASGKAATSVARARAQGSPPAHSVAQAPAARGQPPAQPQGPAQVATGPRIIAAQPEPLLLGWQQPAGALGMPGLSVAWPAPPSHLGGPKASDSGDALAPVAEGRMDFLRGAHRAACRIFGTVLGPDANPAHRNHFHLDMAERKVITICE